MAAYGRESDVMLELLAVWTAVLIDTEQFSEARRLALEALTLTEEKYGRAHEYAKVVMLLGNICHGEEQFEKALALYEEALPLIQEGSSWLCTLLHHMSGALENLGQFPQALDICRKELSLCLVLHGQNHPEYATSLAHTAWLHSKLKQFDSASAHLQQALAIREKVFGYNHPLTVDTRHGVAFNQRALQCRDVANTHASGHRMCNRCGAVGTSDGEAAFGRCPFCKRHYFCSKECSEATSRGLDAHIAVCMDAPDNIGGNKHQCRRCQNSRGTKLCASCKQCTYCSVECQQADWARHRKCCGK